MKRSPLLLAVLLLALAGCPGGGSPDGGPGPLLTGAGPAIQLTASGEVLALGGYGFPPATVDDPAFVDGWEVKFSKLLVTIDHVTFSQSPDRSPTDQSQVGPAVARIDGPWAVDLHQGGPLTGKGGTDEQAVALAKIDNQNLNGGAAFDPTARYAFGFDLVPATAAATRVQLATDDPDYAEMVQKGWVVLYVGTATWKGDQCTSTNAAFDFGALPTTVNFRLGFASPSSYLNCQNPDNDPATPLGAEEHQRGVQVKSNQTVVAQVTVHTDHPFWESFAHDAPLHFDQLAALATRDGGVATVTLEDAARGNFTAFTSGGAPLPWRSCLAGYAPPTSDPQMSFDSLSVPYNPSGAASAALRSYADYMTYGQSTQGHLNADGLCFVQRGYPSPP